MTPESVVKKWADKPFAYGADCCQFAGEMVEALHGFNPMNAFSYADEREANRIIGEYGNLEAAITATLGNPHFEPAEGDVVVVDQTDGSQIAGVVFEGRILVRARKGFIRWPRAYARRAWSCRKQYPL